jgi:hypothetical protein
MHSLRRGICNRMHRMHRRWLRCARQVLIEEVI